MAIKMDIQRLVDSCFNEDYSRFEIPMELLFRFDNFFEKNTEGNYVLCIDANVRVFAPSSPSNRWMLNLENDGIPVEEFQKAMLDFVSGHEGQSMDVVDFEKDFLDWKSEMEANSKNGNKSESRTL